MFGTSATQPIYCSLVHEGIQDNWGIQDTGFTVLWVPCLLVWVKEQEGTISYNPRNTHNQDTDNFFNPMYPKTPSGSLLSLAADARQQKTTLQQQRAPRALVLTGARAGSVPLLSKGLVACSGYGQPARSAFSSDSKMQFTWNSLVLFCMTSECKSADPQLLICTTTHKVLFAYVKEYVYIDLQDSCSARPQRKICPTPQ